MIQRALALLLVVAGCTDFDDLPRGVCGNGVVETGEDCDSGDPACVRCAVTCRIAADCPNADYRCGVDRLCHAPGGTLAQPTAPVTFQVDDLRITDVDRDGRGDVVGVSKTSIVVRHGDPAGALSAAESFVTPAQSGPPAFGDLDGDGVTDVILATADGVVSYTSPFGTLSPVDIESPIIGEDGERLDFARLFPVGPQQLGAFVVDSGFVVLAVIDFTRPNGVYFAAPCLARLGPIPRARFVLPSVELYRATADELVIAFVTDGGAVCATSVHGTPLAGYTFADITPAGTGALAKFPVLADLDADADRCPALVSSDGGPAALKLWDGALAAGRCTLAAAPAALPAIPSVPPAAFAIGRAPLDPPIAGLAADALVMTSGLYAHVPSLGQMAAIYSSSRKLGRVAFGDVDQDGDTDIVVAPADEDDLDILLRFPLGLELFRVDTASRISSLTIGDFDGNGIDDVAYTEAAVGHHDMRIAYGTPDRPLPPVRVATFSDVGSVTPIQFRDSVDQLGIAEDLAVIQPGIPTPTMTILHGSPQRTMLSFFDPRNQAVGDKTTLRSAVVGSFAASADDRPDLLAIASPHQDQLGLGMLAWRVAGVPGGLDPTPTGGLPSGGVADCQLAAPGGGSARDVCVEDTLAFVWPDPGKRDVVFALDRPAGALAIGAQRLDPWASSARLTATSLGAVVQGLPAGVAPRAMHAADLDGDGRPELIASFASRPGAPLAGSVRACTVADGGVVGACEELAPVIRQIAPSVADCFDAAPGRVTARDRTTTPTPAADLVVLCADAAGATALYTIEHAGTARTAALLAPSDGLRAIRVGDVTGDGIDDVVARQGEAGPQSLVVLAQCTSRDADNCRSAAAAAAGGAP
jgi:hypothetical protein